MDVIIRQYARAVLYIGLYTEYNYLNSGVREMSGKRDFFISYNKADQQWAEWIAAVLEGKGYSTYIQAWDFCPGGNFVLDMQNASGDSERFIAVLSDAYMNSEYCQPEWAAAFTKDPNGKKRLLIPVRVSDIRPAGLFAAIIYIDLFGKNEKEAENTLIEGIATADIPRDRPSSFPGAAATAAKVRFPGSLPFHNLPYIRNIYFTGRAQILDDMNTAFKIENNVSLTQSLTAMGGLGKTQLAVEYAYRHAPEYDCIWWVLAENDSTVLADYKRFAVRKELLKPEQQDPDIIIATVLDWLDNNSDWLFIYDNAGEITGTTPWWPRNNKGHILITTRNRKIQIGKHLDVSLFSEEEAVGFLIKRTEFNDVPGAELLSRRLGYFPLALEQAAAYMKVNNDIQYADYLALLEEYGLEVLDDIDGVTHYDKSIRATLTISIDKIESEASKQLLYMCAYVASDNITPEMFADNRALLPVLLGGELSDALKSNRIWKELTQYSLLKKQETNGYSMHRLLQAVVRDRLHENPEWARYCLDILKSTYKFSYDAQDKFLLLSPHVEAFYGSAHEYLTDDESQAELALLCSTAGFGNYNLGNYAGALEWFEKDLAISEKVLGIEHPSTATTCNNIASVYDKQGEYAKALEWYGKALAISEKVLGKEHPSTATTYNNIAMVYSYQGDYAKALEWFEKALTIREKVLGKQHPDTATTYNNIATVYSDKGEYAGALEWYEKAMAIKEKVLSKQHTDTATTYNNMATVYSDKGEYAGALEWYGKALAIREKVLGKEHPDTATTYNNIAGVYADQGDYAKALEWYEKALAICEKALGKEHPNTAKSYNNIAGVYCDQGDYAKALEWYGKALEILEKVLGKQHPNTTLVKANIAALRAAMRE